MEVVWYKRDLRVQDHEPLFLAAQSGPVLPLYVVEPDYWNLPDTSFRHWQFLTECLQELAASCRELQCPLYIATGDVIDVLHSIHRQCAVDRLWSHEETGNLWTYDRDKRVAAWCADSSIEWREFAQHGVIRRLKSRHGWARQWDRQMRSTVFPKPDSITPCRLNSTEEVTSLVQFDAMGCGKKSPANRGDQTGGRKVAVELLDSFLHQRGERYQKEMSSPVLAKDSCSRLSAHLAFGCVSIKEVFQAVERRQQAIRAMPVNERGMWGKSLHSYAGRLHWHCHFIQKLEDQPRHEVDHVHRGFEGMREGDFNRAYFEAWSSGQTGYPFIDACMRFLNATGWINFRMRAMLMSFAAYHLWLHWREPGLYLARAFTDYEPGIHWNQVQMQSGTTGINTVRIYNPVKQSKDQDPQGKFIRQWVPELSGVSGAFIHEPWLMNNGQQRRSGALAGSSYPTPIVDHLSAAKQARDRIYAVRRGDGFREIADRIQNKHGSRKSGVSAPARSKKQKKSSRQLGLGF